jgi:hypothetical protein
MRKCFLIFHFAGTHRKLRGRKDRYENTARHSRICERGGRRKTVGRRQGDNGRGGKRESFSLPFSKAEGRHQMMGFSSGLLKGE